MSKLLKLKKWLTLDDAALHITREIKATITVTDLYLAALEGKLKLSVYFVNNAHGITGELCNVGDIENQLAQQTFDTKERTVHCMEGVWDLTMQGQEALEVKGYFEQSNSGIEVTTLSENGILLQQNDVTCQLYKHFDRERIFNPKYNESEERQRAIAEEPMRALENDPSIISPHIRRNKFGSEFVPCHKLSEVGSVLIVRSSEITHFIEYLEDEHKEEKPLTTNERNSLLVLIATLCKEAKVDWNQRGITASLVAMTSLAGTPLSPDTVLKIVKQIDPAIESRSK